MDAETQERLAKFAEDAAAAHALLAPHVEFARSFLTRDTAATLSGGTTDREFAQARVLFRNGLQASEKFVWEIGQMQARALQELQRRGEIAV